MKVLALNGSARKNGNTYHSLRVVLNELEKQDVETEIMQVGSLKLRGCLACNWCGKNKTKKCIIKDDEVNDIIAKMEDADGIILGSPVYWSAMNGTLKSALDRIFYVSSANGNLFRHKVGASVVAVRRSGGIPTFDQLNNYLLYSEMFVPGSNYWNVAHGTSPNEIDQDEEGLQIMRILGKNLMYLLQMRELAEKNLNAPEQEQKVFTNFVR